MSLLALLGGVLLYRLYFRKSRALGATPLSNRLDGRRNFDVIIVAVVRVAGRVVRAVSSNRLQPQLALLVLSTIGIASTAAIARVLLAPAANLSPVDPVFALMWIVGAVCAVGAAMQAKFHRLAALVMAGGAGLITCLTFAWFSAPDLALTQISVEVVTTVLILLGLRWLPKRLELDDPSRRTLRARARRARDVALAAVAGTGMAALAYAILARPQGPGIAPFFFERVLAEGGRNVVNVILVDFRGFDTMGEITVVGIVALTVYKLLRRFRPPPESMSVPRAQREDAAREQARDLSEWLPRGPLRIPAVLGKLLLPVAGVLSIFFLLRGHGAPGGGFVGGLVMAIAFIVQYMFSGTIWVESRMRIHPQYWMGAGLLCAAAAGMGAWLASRAFLSSLEWEAGLPLIGELHLSSTLLFDVGVYLLVIGATTLMLIALAHQSLRSPRQWELEDTATTVWRDAGARTESGVAR
jgi:multicomponent K+:H+ antiporter subunit A